VRDGRRLDDASALEPRRLGTDVVLEQPYTVAQQHWDEVDLHLVEQPGLHVLLRDARAATNRDVHPARGRPSLPQRCLGAIRDERERRFSFGLPVPGMVGDDEDGVVEEGLVTLCRELRYAERSRDSGGSSGDEPETSA
jgi:hypothetical protein